MNFKNLQNRFFFKINMNKKQTTGNIIKRLFFIGMKFKTRFIWALIVSVILASVSVYRPIFTQHIVDIDILKLKQWMFW
jgi:ABC-type multidrug transport system fused ATPase/permease subunit